LSRQVNVGADAARTWDVAVNAAGQNWDAFEVETVVGACEVWYLTESWTIIYSERTVIENLKSADRIVFIYYIIMISITLQL